MDTPEVINLPEITFPYGFLLCKTGITLMIYL